jgi:hypothetical protein
MSVNKIIVHLQVSKWMLLICFFSDVHFTAPLDESRYLNAYFLFELASTEAGFQHW